MQGNEHAGQHPEPPEQHCRNGQPAGSRRRRGSRMCGQPAEEADRQVAGESHYVGEQARGQYVSDS
jgi:hypothetical protein